MTSPVINAFNSDLPGSAHDRKGVQGATRPMRAMAARVEAGDDVTTLELSPIRPVDLVLALQHADSPNHALTLLMPARGVDGTVTTAFPAEAVMSRLRIPVVDRFGDDLMVADDAGLADLLRLLALEDVMMVRVPGPIEACDAHAMARVAAMGRSPLDAEVRATSVAQVIRGRDVTLQTRNRETALAVVCENLRHFLAALTSRPIATIAPLARWQADRLLSVTGRITVRPIETQVFGTFIDVGVNTSETGEERPADRCLIYDLPSNSWHDED